MHRPTKRSGRISFVALGGIVSLALVALLLFSTGQSPRSAAAMFMTALAQGDVDKLTDLSVINNKPKDVIHKEWEETVKYSRGYFFHWAIKSMSQSGDTATVRVDRIEHLESPGSYEEKFELQLVKTKDGWKVDVPQIARPMFPYLPQ
jgi:hypothetical protein